MNESRRLGLTQCTDLSRKLILRKMTEMPGSRSFFLTAQYMRLRDSAKSLPASQDRRLQHTWPMRHFCRPACRTCRQESCHSTRQNTLLRLHNAWGIDPRCRHTLAVWSLRYWFAPLDSSVCRTKDEGHVGTARTCFSQKGPPPDGPMRDVMVRTF